MQLFEMRARVGRAYILQHLTPLMSHKYSQNLQNVKLREDTSDDKVQAHHTKRNHAMPCQPCLPSQTCTNPQCHSNTPLFLKIGSHIAYLFLHHCIAVAKTQIYQKIQSWLTKQFWSNVPSTRHIDDKVQAHHTKPTCHAMQCLALPCLGELSRGERACGWVPYCCMCHAQAPCCLSVEWALIYCFVWFYGTAPVFEQGWGVHILGTWIWIANRLMGSLSTWSGTTTTAVQVK